MSGPRAPRKSPPPTPNPLPRKSSLRLDALFGEEVADEVPLVALDLDDPFLAVHDVGAAGAALLLELRRELLEEDLGFGQLVYDRHRLAGAAGLLDAQHRHEVI